MRILAVLFFLSLVGCGKSTAQTTIVNGASVSSKSPTDFYKKFLFRLVGDCPHVAYRYASSKAEKIAVNSKGQDVLNEVSLFLKENGEYQAYYQEITVYRYTENGFFHDKNESRVVKGKWKILGEALYLAGFGEVRGILYEGGPKLLLYPEKDLISRGVAGKGIVLSYVEGTGVPIPSLRACR